MKILSVIQIVAAIVLMISILLQNRGAGLSSTFGGDFGGYYTKRGFEKFLTRLSVFLSFVFISMAIAIFILSNRG
jgi:protein translocase SecG subunit